ncbi:hypothetical protein ALC56_04168 [Trachymyrmex septentrionalis]|uniref:Uncharacterized protein n=1 Tax=Trachymyrmex septentrionalis TaxID=34720 RepID=A0A151K3R7_9HYME|nr:hypothetical protein ALC56_04168 [Trachymyrmex septentrionalis]
MVICRYSTQNITFGESDQRGLDFKFIIRCRCDQTSINCDPFIKDAYKINLRIVFVMRLLSIVRKGINIFCELMPWTSASSYNIKKE